MVNSHLERIFFHNILKNPAYLDAVDLRFFDSAVLKKLVRPIKGFYSKYHEVPTMAQVQEIVKLENLDKEISPDQISTAWDLDLGDYDEAWLKDNTETFLEYKNLDISTVDLVDYLKSTNVTPENIKEVVNKAKSIIVTRNNLDFAFDEGSDFFDASAHRQPVHQTFSSGYNFIDLAADGGWAAKTLNVFLGAPKVGKSTWLANIASQAVMAGNNTAIITLEMSEAKYLRRLGANMLNVKMEDYKRISNDQEFIKQRLGNLSGNSGLTLPGKLFVKEFATSTASAIDIENYLRRMEEKNGMKFKVVIIDYINIMKNWRNPNTENTYMKIKQIAEDVRAMAQSNDWAVISATQTKQTFFGSSDMSMSAASESSALVATVDLMFGIIQDTIMKLNNKYKLKVLASRDGTMSEYSKMYDVNYAHMRITEDASPPLDPELVVDPNQVRTRAAANNR